MHNIIISSQTKDGYCGPVALGMVLSFYGLNLSEEELRKVSKCSIKGGTTANDLVNAAISLGFDSFYKDNCNWNDLENEVKKYPVIVNWFSINSGHYGVAIHSTKKDLTFADPEYGLLKKMPKSEFLPVWFDYNGEYPKSLSDFIMRRMIIVKEKI